MSDKQLGKYSKADFSNLSETQLRDLLQAELESEETDVALIKEAVAALNQKTGKSGCHDVDAAWNAFVQDYSVSQPLYTDLPASVPPVSQPHRRRGRMLIKAAAIAAAVLVLLTFTASALGYDILGAIAQWTDETFSLLGRNTTESSDAAYTYAPELEEVHTALLENGVTANVLPLWLPEGYELTAFYTFDMHGGDSVFESILADESDSNMIRISYTIRESFSPYQYQKNAGDPEIYTINDIDFYIMSNIDNYFAVWINGNVECSISGVQSREDLIQMIDSIYWEE